MPHLRLGIYNHSKNLVEFQSIIEIRSSNLFKISGQTSFRSKLFFQLDIIIF